MRTTLLVLCVAGCGVPEMPATTVSLASDAALSDMPFDPLFHLTLTSAGASYAFADLFVIAVTPGQTTTQLACALDDTDGDGRLDVRESLRCLEPPTNCFDASTVGKAVQIELTVRSSNHELDPVATAEWLP